MENKPENLILKDGIYYTPNNTTISYPEEGNSICYQVEDSSFWFQHRNKCIKEIVTKYPSDGIIYDLGGGNGVVSKFLQENNIDVALIEPGNKGALNAKSRGVKNIYCCTFEDIGFENNSICGIGMFDVLEHIKNDKAFLLNLHKTIKPGGKLYLTLPTYRILWSLEDKIAGHYRRYTLKTIKKLLKQTGFEVNYSSYFFAFLVFPIFIFRTLPSLMFKQKTNKETASADHNKDNKTINKILSYEFKKIKQLKRIPMGSSCIIAATKI